MLWASATAWLGLGLMAFAARLFVEPVVSGSPGRPLLLAATFAALYVVSGVLAIGAAYNAYNPDAWALRRAAKNLKQARADAAAARAACAAAEEEVKRLAEELQRAPDRLDSAVKKTEADERTARSHARLTILARIKDPGAASAFTP